MLTNLIQKIIPLRGNEGKPFFFCFAIAFLLGITFALGGSTTTALFLKEFGAKYLPLMIAVNAAAVILVFSFYNRFNGKLSNTKVFYGIFILFSMALLIISLILFRNNPPHLIYPIMLALFAVYSAITSIHFYNYLIDFFDTQQSKRLLPSIMSANILGAMFGGLMIPFLLALPGGIGTLFLFWIIFLAANSILIFLNSANVTLQKAGGLGDEEANEGFLASFKNNINVIKSSRFIRLTLIAGFISEILYAGSEITSQTIFANSPIFTDAESLTSFYGTLGAIIAAIGFFIQVFIVPQLIKRGGVGSLNLILPLAFLISSTGMAFLPFLAFYFAIIVRFNILAVAEYIEPTANNLLLNSLSPRQKTQVLSFASGFVEPFAPILAGGLLTVLTSFFQLESLMFVFAFFSISYFFIAWRQNHAYSQELMHLLQSQNFDLFKSASEGMYNLSPQVFAELDKKLASADEEEALVAAEILADIRKKNAIPVLCKRIDDAGNELQAVILQIFMRLGENTPQVLVKIAARLKDDNALVRQNAVMALDYLDKENQYEAEVFDLLNDTDTNAASLAAIYLLDPNIKKIEHRRAAIDLIKGNLQKNEKSVIIAVLQSCSHLKNNVPEIIAPLIELLKGHSIVAKESVRTLHAIFNHLPIDTWLPFIPEIKQELKSPLREIRLFAFQLLAKTNKLDEAEIIQALGDSYEKVQELASQFVLETIFFTLEQVRDLRANVYNLFLWRSALLLEAKRYEHKNPAEILRLANYALEQAGVFLNQVVYIERRYRNRDEFLMLQTVMRDQLHFCIHTAILLLGELKDDRIVKIIKKSLISSNSRLRANALEILENFKIEGISKTVRLLDTMISKLPYEEKWKLMCNNCNMSFSSSLEDIFASNLSANDDWKKSIAEYAIEAARKDGEVFSAEFEEK